MYPRVLAYSTHTRERERTSERERKGERGKSESESERGWEGGALPCIRASWHTPPTRDRASRAGPCWSTRCSAATPPPSHVRVKYPSHIRVIVSRRSMLEYSMFCGAIILTQIMPYPSKATPHPSHYQAQVTIVCVCGGGEGGGGAVSVGVCVCGVRGG